MTNRKTLWLTFFVVSSLLLVFGSNGFFTGETSSEIDAVVLAAPERIESTDVQVNWSGGDVYPKTTQSETSVRVNPNTGTICVAYNDSQDGGLGVFTATGHSRSTDGGATFVDGGSFLPGSAYNADPSLAWRARDGFFYYAAIGSPSGIWRSTDDCETFSYFSDLVIPDREMMVIDNNPDSIYYGRFYVAWNGVEVAYSDNGIIWVVDSLVNPAGFAPWPAVDPVSGDVYVASTHFHNDDRHMDIEIVISTQGGVPGTWNPLPNPVSSGVIPYDPVATDNCGGEALNGDISHPVAPQIVVDNYRNLHLVYARDPDGAEVGDVIDVYYRRSTNQGLTWGPEVRLNDDATDNDQWFPTISVGPTGTVVATWYDRRHDPVDNLKFDYYMATSLDNGVTWGANIRISDVSSELAPLNPHFDMKKCYHGDYDQQVQHGAFAYITWSDDRNLLTDIPEPHHDPDVWFEKVLVTPDLYHPIYLPLVTK